MNVMSPGSREGLSSIKADGWVLIFNSALASYP